LAQAKVPIHKNSLALIAAGSNLPSTSGDSARTIVDAIACLPGEMGALVSISRLFRTPAFPKGSGPDFVNAVCALRTDWQAAEILARLHVIEAEAGRERHGRWQARTLDLDLIALGDEVWPDLEGQKDWMALDPARQRVEAPDRLILPHPRLQDRAFVLIPLADICPAWRHPVTGVTVPDMIAALPEADKEAIWPV
jgi:2-amino-4-hydroxy-6-hydroxymethyldihydropteridine diphosphokinase